MVRRGAAIGEDPSVHELDDPVGAGGEPGIVRHHEHGEAALLVEAAKQGEYLIGGLGIEVAGGLIGEQQHRPVKQRAGDRHPLLLPSRKLGGLAPPLLGLEPDGSEQGLGLDAKRRRQAPPVTGEARQQHVLEGAEGGEEVMELEHEAERLAAKPRALGLLHLARRPLEQEHFAGAWPIEQPEQVEEGALARAGRPDQRGELPAREGEIDTMQHLLSHRALAVGLAYALKPNDRAHARSASTGSSRAARRAGKAAASIPTSVARRMAARKSSVET